MHVGFGERRGETCIIQDTRRPAPILQVAERKKDLDARVTEAFEQIHDREYYKGMEGRTILIGLAFWKKIPKARIESVMNGDGSAHPDAGS